MILKRIITPSTFHKVRQLESLSRNGSLTITCSLPHLGRASSTLANAKQYLNHNILKNGCNNLRKLPITITLGNQVTRKASAASGDHVRLWVCEKIVSAILPILIPAALLTENAILDGAMSILVVMHSHWGLEAVITDYARPIVVGTALPKILHLALFTLSIATLAGLFVLINNGPGVSRAIKDAWAIGKKPSA